MKPKQSIIHENIKTIGNKNYLSISGYVENKADKVLLWFNIIGDKNNPIVTLISGTEGSSVYWSEEIIGALLLSDYRVLIYDARDTGKSTWVKWPKNFDASKWTPGDETPYRFHVHYEDLQCLWGYLKVKRSHIIGVSQGGMIGQIAAIEHSDSVITLSLLSTSPTNQFDEKLDPLTEAFYRPVKKMAMKVGIQASMRWLFFNKYIDSATDMFMYLLDANEDERIHIKAYFKQVHSWGGYNVKSAQGFAYVNQESRVDKLESITTPTLILHGDRDNFFSTKHVEALNKGIKDSKLIIIKSGLHAIPVSMYHEYLPDIIKHMGSNNSFNR